MPRVDVIIPAFNPGEYLRDAVESVIGQTFIDWRCYIVDDGSTEDLSWVDVVEPRVRRVRQPNGGLSAARNRGLTEGDAPLVAFLDADDLWLPDKLLAQVTAVGDAPHVLCSTGFDYIDASGAHLGEGLRGFTGSYAEQLVLCAVAISTAMMHRADLERVAGFASDLQQVQDWDLYLRLTGAGTTAVHVPDVHALYRKHVGNMSSNYIRLRTESLRILAAHRAAAVQRGDVALAALAQLGESRVQRLAGIKAFDSFRDTYSTAPIASLRHLSHAGRWAPSYTTRAVASKLLARILQ